MGHALWTNKFDQNDSGSLSKSVKKQTDKQPNTWRWKHHIFVGSGGGGVGEGIVLLIL